MGSYRAQSVGPIRRSGVVELGFRFRGCWAEYLILFQRIWECDRCVPLNQFLKKTCQFFSDFLWKIRDQQPLLSKVAVHRKQLFGPNKQDEDRFFFFFNPNLKKSHDNVWDVHPSSSGHQSRINTKTITQGVKLQSICFWRKNIHFSKGL